MTGFRGGVPFASTFVVFHASPTFGFQDGFPAFCFFHKSDSSLAEKLSRRNLHNMGVLKYPYRNSHMFLTFQVLRLVLLCCSFWKLLSLPPNFPTSNSSCRFKCYISTSNMSVPKYLQYEFPKNTRSGRATYFSLIEYCVLWRCSGFFGNFSLPLPNSLEEIPIVLQYWDLMGIQKTKFGLQKKKTDPN